MWTLQKCELWHERKPPSRHSNREIICWIRGIYLTFWHRDFEISFYRKMTKVLREFFFCVWEIFLIWNVFLQQVESWKKKIHVCNECYHYVKMVDWRNKKLKHIHSVGSNASSNANAADERYSSCKTRVSKSDRHPITDRPTMSGRRSGVGSRKELVGVDFSGSCRWIG